MQQVQEQTEVHLDSDIKFQIQKLGETIHEFKHQNDKLIESELKGKVDVMLSEQVDRINSAISNAEEAKLMAEKAQIASKKVSLQAGSSESSSSDIALKNACTKFVRLGEDKLNSEELKLLKANHDRYNFQMSNYDDNQGAYSIIPEMDQEVTRLLYETSQLRPWATIKNIGTDQYEKLQRPDLAGAVWRDRETETPETSTPTFRKISIKVNNLDSNPVLPNNLINDSFTDIVSELNEAVAQQMTLTENLAFVRGDGNGTPRGFLTYPAGTSWGQIEQVNSGNASTFDADAVLSLIYSMNSGYQEGSVMAGTRATMEHIRKFKGQGAEYLWQPSFQAGQPSLVAGVPFVQFQNMDEIAANSLPLVFANFRRGYIIVDRAGTQILVNPYRKTGYVTYETTRRVGGGVDNFDAIKLLKIAV